MDQGSAENSGAQLGCLIAISEKSTMMHSKVRKIVNPDCRSTQFIKSNGQRETQALAGSRRQLDPLHGWD